MGADIHAYLEYKEKNSNYWRSMTSNYGSRDYLWFAIVAGVRDYEGNQVFEPKGIPEGSLSSEVHSSYWRYITEDDNEYMEGRTSRARAEEWIEKKYSIGKYNDAGKLTHVSDPDDHSHSWFTKDELLLAIDAYKDKANKYEYFDGRTPQPVEWIAVAAAMVAFEALDYECRLVFWFDN